MNCQFDIGSQMNHHSGIGIDMNHSSGIGIGISVNHQFGIGICGTLVNMVKQQTKVGSSNCPIVFDPKYSCYTSKQLLIKQV